MSKEDKMTYKELLQQITKLSTGQLESEVMVEIVGLEEIFYPAEIRVCDIEHDRLDEDDVVIFVP